MARRHRHPSYSNDCQLPSESDFDPYGGGLDAQTAWKNFGGLSLEKAYEKFCTNPHEYQEDFMFMGSRAFRFYFSVIEKYLHEVSNESEGDCGAWILTKGIEAQFQWREAVIDARLRDRIVHLSVYVRSHLCQYARSPKVRTRIDQAWSALQGRASTDGEGS